jgi:hypothetical protein
VKRKTYKHKHTKGKTNTLNKNKKEHSERKKRKKEKKKKRKREKKKEKKKTKKEKKEKGKKKKKKEKRKRKNAETVWTGIRSIYPFWRERGGRDQGDQGAQGRDDRRVVGRRSGARDTGHQRKWEARAKVPRSTFREPGRKAHARARVHRERLVQHGVRREGPVDSAHSARVHSA